MLFDLPAAIWQQCQEILDCEIRAVRQVSGGDINQARLIETDSGRFFIKTNDSPQAARMFETEAKGLDLLKRTNCIRIPGIIASGSTADGAFLLLEYIETGRRTPGFWEKFGEALVALHRHTAVQFGLDHQNFIGSLPQSNHFQQTWATFYTHERLQPQLNLALRASLLNHSDATRFEKLYEKLPEICPFESPALIHGDLWSGNFMIGPAGQPVLIDPAISYSHREMDLAMSRLFGGFDRAFYSSYEEAFPLAPGFEQRLPVYHLYYLLVHVNLFGGGYVRQVRAVLEKFI